MTDNFRRLLTCANDGGRVIILRQTCRMPFDGGVHGYLNPTQCSRWGVCPLGLRGCEISHLGTRTLMCPKTIEREKGKKLKSVVHVGRPGGEIY
jgi:hypothetical protein